MSSVLKIKSWPLRLKIITVLMLIKITMGIYEEATSPEYNLQGISGFWNYFFISNIIVVTSFILFILLLAYLDQKILKNTASKFKIIFFYVICIPTIGSAVKTIEEYLNSFYDYPIVRDRIISINQKMEMLDVFYENGKNLKSLSYIKVHGGVEIDGTPQFVLRYLEWLNSISNKLDKISGQVLTNGTKKSLKETAVSNMRNELIKIEDIKKDLQNDLQILKLKIPSSNIKWSKFIEKVELNLKSINAENKKSNKVISADTPVKQVETEISNIEK